MVQLRFALIAAERVDILNGSQPWIAGPTTATPSENAIVDGGKEGKEEIRVENWRHIHSAGFFN